MDMKRFTISDLRFAMGSALQLQTLPASFWRSDRRYSWFTSPSGGLHDLLRRVGHRVAADNRQAGFVQCHSASLDVIAFEADDEWQGEMGLLHRGHYACGNGIAVHYAPENVD